MDIANLNEQFSRLGTDGIVHLYADDHGLPFVKLQWRATVASVHLHGAHLTSYRPMGRDQVLFLGRSARFEPGKAIRGGIPICFPWFGANPDRPEGPSHGLARTAEWSLHETAATKSFAEALFTIKLEELACHYRVRLGDALELTLGAVNEGQEPTRIEGALHSYFSVGDVREVSLQGLEKTTYLDQLQNREPFEQSDEPLRFRGETDRIYLQTEPRKIIDDPRLDRKIIIETKNAPSTVVWNPWIEKTARMGGLEDDEWPSFLCVETGLVADDAQRLDPAASWEMSTTIHVGPR